MTQEVRLMTDRIIGVEENLTPVVHLLTEKGYNVESVDFSTEFRKNIDKYDALVITGLNKDFLGVQDTVSQIPVIDAKGLSAEEVYTQLTAKFEQ
jgi:hypothetical protein